MDIKQIKKDLQKYRQTKIPIAGWLINKFKNREKLQEQLYFDEVVRLLNIITLSYEHFYKKSDRFLRSTHISTILEVAVPLLKMLANKLNLMRGNPLLHDFISLLDHCFTNRFHELTADEVVSLVHCYTKYNIQPSRVFINKCERFCNEQAESFSLEELPKLLKAMRKLQIRPTQNLLDQVSNYIDILNMQSKKVDLCEITNILKSLVVHKYILNADINVRLIERLINLIPDAIRNQDINISLRYIAALISQDTLLLKSSVILRHFVHKFLNLPISCSDDASPSKLQHEIHDVIISHLSNANTTSLHKVKSATSLTCPDITVIPSSVSVLNSQITVEHEKDLKDGLCYVDLFFSTDQGKKLAIQVDGPCHYCYNAALQMREKNYNMQTTVNTTLFDAINIPLIRISYEDFSRQTKSLSKVILDEITRQLTPEDQLCFNI